MDRIVIAGSRDFTNYNTFKSFTLDYLTEHYDCSKPNRKNIEIISGGCRGTDKMAEKLAKEFDFPFKEFPAEWDKYEGKSAGYERNKAMAEYASKENGVLIAFYCKGSKGTKMMIDLAKKYGLKRYIVTLDYLTVYE